VGENGLITAVKFLELVDSRLSDSGQNSFLAIPNVFWWFGASDLALNLACALGAALWQGFGSFTCLCLIPAESS